MTPLLKAIRKDALEFLRKNFVAALATSSNGQPCASAVYYIVDEDFTFYFVTQENTQKYSDLARNKRVAMVIGTGPEHISVSVRGIASPITNNEEATAIFERMLMLMFQGHIKRWPIRDMAKFKQSKIRVFKVKPTRLTFMNLDDENYSTSLSDRYERIIP